MADSLPRPFTPGPWRIGMPNFRCRVDHGQGGAGHGTPACVFEHVDWHDWSTYVYQDRKYANRVPGQNNDDAGMVVGMWDYEEGGVREEQDAQAIAALPERIRRMDAVRAYCEQIIRPDRTDQMPAHVAARTILSLLDGEVA